MQKQNQGIDFNRLINPENYKDLEEVIKCKICFQILLIPVDCDNCRYSFCHDCINLLKSENKPCPFGCNLQNYNTNTSSVGIKSILSGLTFKCRNPECETPIPYNDILIHDKTCTYRRVYCPNCKEQIKSFELESHVKDNCKYRTRKCDNCNEEVLHKDFDLHLSVCSRVASLLNGKEPASLKEFIYPGADFVKVMLKQIGRLIDDKLVDYSRKSFEKIDEKLNTIVNGVSSKENEYKQIIERLDSISNRLDTLERSIILNNPKILNLDDKDEVRKPNHNNPFISECMDLNSITVKGKLDSLENKFEEISYDVKNHIDSALKQQFDFVWCPECKKIDNGISVKNCEECNSRFCKDCGLKCRECQNIFCEKCVCCPRCKEKICLNCRKVCSSCKNLNKYCKKCITECKNCKNINCIDCLKTCSQCNLIICGDNICSNTCRHCSKSLCKKCQKLTENPITPCNSCKIHYSCRNCYIICSVCKNQCCKNCLHKCKKCNKTLCLNCTKDCPSCKENYCDDCSTKAFSSKCCRCGKFFCTSCVKINTGKCNQCSELNCKTCLQLCGNCSRSMCVKDIATCKQCGGFNCLNCITTCHCTEVKFCQGCKMDISPISPHDCIFWLNETPYFTGVKSRSKKELPLNFEVKLFIEKMKGDSVSIGITDNNSFQDNSIIFVDQIWTLRLKTGMKYSTNKSVESYLKAGAKEYDTVYIRCEGTNLYFKLNNENPPPAYAIDKTKKYYLYIENEEARKECKISIIYIIKI
jgi:hypothetical protein